MERDVVGVARQKPETIRTMVIRKDSKFLYVATNRGFVYKVDLSTNGVVHL